MDEEKLMKEVYKDSWKLAKKFLEDNDWEAYLTDAEDVRKKYEAKSKKQELLARQVMTGQTYYFEYMLKEVKSEEISENNDGAEEKGHKGN